jgi:serine/threonine protein kinase
MTFAPERFAGSALPDLLQELAQQRTEEVVAGLLKPLPRRSVRTRGASASPSTHDWRTATTHDWHTTWLFPRQPGPTVPGATPPEITSGDVQLERYLGGGQQGAVYVGRLQSTGLVVAVKVFRGDDAEGEEQALREMRVGMKLRHPNILRIFRADQAGGFWVVVMEFLQGEDLSRSWLSVQQVKPLLGQLAGAVLEMARTRVVHRDIKPANIVLRHGDNAPVLVDFGLAVDLEMPAEAMRISGTPLFMAPEAFSAESPDPSWDAYSLGMTTVALLLGDRLPRKSGRGDIIHDKVSGHFDQEVSRLLPNIPDEETRTWCSALLGTPSRRLAALEQVRTSSPARSEVQ